MEMSDPIFFHFFSGELLFNYHDLYCLYWEWIVGIEYNSRDPKYGKKKPSFTIFTEYV